MMSLDLQIAIEGLVYNKFENSSVSPTVDEVEAWGEVLKETIDLSVEQFIEDRL